MSSDREGIIQRQIVSYLYATCPPDVCWHSVPNEQYGGKDGARMGARMNANGRKSGVADLLVVANGRAHYLEVKAPADGTRYRNHVLKPAGKQSTEQKAFQINAEAAGARYAVVWSLDDAIAALTEWNVPTRARRAA